MKKYFSLAITVLVSLFVSAQNTEEIAIIPQPVSLQKSTGSFSLVSTVPVSFPANNPEIAGAVDHFRDRIERSGSLKVTTSTGAAQKNGISISLINDPAIGNEGYRLEVSPEGITIQANKPAGVFYGFQTLIQLMPKEIE